MWFLIVFLSLLVVVGFYVYKCVQIIQPNEMGVRVVLGEPKHDPPLPLIVGTNLYWTWWPFEWIVRYTKNVMQFNFVVESVMTERGKIDGHPAIIEPAEINISCVLYAYFDPENLHKTIEAAPGNTENDLGPVLVPYVIDVIRALGGRVPWRVINDQRHYTAEWILARLAGGNFYEINEATEKLGAKDEYKRFSFKDDSRESLNQNVIEEVSPFLQFGLRGLSLAILDVNLHDPDLAAVYGDAEKARLKKHGIELEADAERYRLKEEGKGNAKAREKMIKAIKSNPDLEVLQALKEMAQGTSNTILYQIPAPFASRMQDLLGGNNPAEMLRNMTEGDKREFLAALQGLISKLSS